MDNKTKEFIDACIVYLKYHGYEVHDKRDNDKVGKWVAYKRDGMTPILHGKVINVDNGVYHIKKKNRCKDFVRIDNVIDFFDNKEECYSVR